MNGPALLDTNILVALIRGAGPVYDVVSAWLTPGADELRPMASIITAGEVSALTLKLGWGPVRRMRAEALLLRIPLLPVADDVLPHYARIDHHCERVAKPARPMPQNDMWIAATARAAGIPLITTDTDFDHLHPRLLRRVRIEPASGTLHA